MDNSAQSSQTAHASPPINRRRFLTQLGVATLVLVSGAGVYRAFDRGVFSTATGPAFEPWEHWRTEPATGAMRLLQSAILAANPHNTQPWLFRIENNRIDVFADFSRHLGTMDPWRRELYIGLGCAIENMLQTARSEGMDVTVELDQGRLSLDAAGMKHAATLLLRPSSPLNSPLHEAIPFRHTDRSVYRDDPIAGELIDSLLLLNNSPDIRVVTFIRGQDSHTRLSEATVAATEFIIADSQMSHDSHRWFDKNWEELQRDRDGPFIDTSGSSPMIRAVVKMMPPMPDRMIDQGWLSNTKNSVITSPLLGFITVKDLYSQEQSIQAGQLWQRMHLWATTRNLSMQPINQLPEQVDRERQLGMENSTARWLSALIGTASWQPTFVFRMGYPASRVFASARRALNDVLMS